MQKYVRTYVLVPKVVWYRIGTESNYVRIGTESGSKSIAVLYHTNVINS